MATANVTSCSRYASYKNGTSQATSNSTYGRVGYANVSGSVKYSVCYRIYLPSVDGDITSITLVPEIYNTRSTTLTGPKTWQIGISVGGTNDYYAGGDHSTYGSYTQTVSLSGNLADDSGCSLPAVTFSELPSLAFNPGGTLYVYMYSGAKELNDVLLENLTATVTYTPSTKNAVKQTCTYADASASPSSAVYNTTINFTATSFANTDEYIYGNLNFYLTPQGIAFSSTPTKSVSGYAVGLNKSLSLSYSSGMAQDGFYYKATASRYVADPGNATCNASNITTSSARINVASGVTTTFLDSDYRITSTDSGEVVSNPLQSPSLFARSTGYIDLTGLSQNTSYTRYIYVYNSYNNCYYKIGSVSFKTLTADASSYSGTPTSSSTTNSISISLPSVSPTTNLDGNFYIGTSSSSSSITHSAAIGSTITISGLNQNTTYTRYVFVKSIYGTYYYIGYVSPTTQTASWSATVSGSATGSTTASLNISNVSPSSGHNGYWYLSLTNTTSTTSLSTIASAAIGSTMNVSSLSPGTSKVYYVYVHSNGTYYQVASITLKTHSYVYYGASLTPCWTYLGQLDGTLKQVIIYPR